MAPNARGDAMRLKNNTPISENRKTLFK